MINLQGVSETEQSNNNESDDKRFWMNLLTPQGTNHVDKLHRRLNYIELTIALIAMMSILLSQFEYEMEYYPTYYLKLPDYPIDKYKGMPMRYIQTALSAILGIYTI